MRKYFELSIPLDPNQIIKASSGKDYKVSVSKLRGDKIIEKEHWFKIIKNNVRIISTIGEMNDNERMRELEEIKVKYSEVNEIEFFDEVSRILIENK